LNPIDPAETDSIPRGGLESSTLSIPGFTFDFRKIAGRATTLFPFLTPGLSLESFALAPRAETAGIRNPFAAPAPPENAGIRRPPLVMSDAALQSLIDKSWSRRDRWQAFQRLVQLADLYSADEGKLSSVIHAYVEQDGLQP